MEQLLEDQRQQILILAALRDTTEERLGDAELQRAEDALIVINQNIQKLGKLSQGVTELNYDLLWQSSSNLLKRWLKFYRSYNDPKFQMNMNDPLPFLQASQRLNELEQRQEFIAAQRSDIIDRTIDLTDRITVIGFFFLHIPHRDSRIFFTELHQYIIKKAEKGYRTFWQWRP